jgi:hypothetical protein
MLRHAVTKATSTRPVNTIGAAPVIIPLAEHSSSAARRFAGRQITPGQAYMTPTLGYANVFVNATTPVICHELKEGQANRHHTKVSWSLAVFRQVVVCHHSPVFWTILCSWIQQTAYQQQNLDLGKKTAMAFSGWPYCFGRSAARRL